MCYGRTCRARARLGPRDIRGAAAQTLLMDARRRRTERWEPDEGRGRKKRGLLTVCRLNVLGPLLNQLTYCLCGRQPLPCLHGTFLLSSPPPPPSPFSRTVVAVVYRPSSSSSSFFTLPETADTFCVALRLHSRRFSMTDASANTSICLRFLAAARGHHRIFGVCNGRQLKIDAPLSPTIFLPIFVFKFASGYAAPSVCSVGVILTVYRGQGFTSDGGLSCNLFFLCFFFALSWGLTRGKLYTNSSMCLIRDVSRQ